MKYLFLWTLFWFTERHRTSLLQHTSSTYICILVCLFLSTTSTCGIQTQRTMFRIRSNIDSWGFFLRMWSSLFVYLLPIHLLLLEEKKKKEMTKRKYQKEVTKTLEWLYKHRYVTTTLPFYRVDDTFCHTLKEFF